MQLYGKVVTLRVSESIRTTLLDSLGHSDDYDNSCDYYVVTSTTDFDHFFAKATISSGVFRGDKDNLDSDVIDFRITEFYYHNSDGICFLHSLHGLTLDDNNLADFVSY